MSWFSKLIPVQVKEVNKEAEELMSTVQADRKLLEQHTLPVNGVHSKSLPTHVGRTGSALSPFASRILEKARSESLKDDDERGKFSSPSELFIHNEETTKRVERIKSIAFEKSRHAADKFIHGARVIPNTTFHLKDRPRI